VSIPVGFSSKGLPIGLEFDGPAHGDLKLLEICEHAEKILNPYNGYEVGGIVG